MESNAVFLEQVNQYYTVWQEYNSVYEEWAKAHGLSVNSLLVLSALHDGMEECTQKKISQKWRIPKQTINVVLKDMQEDRRNKLIRFTESGKEYADTIISKLRKVELFVVEGMKIERMKERNEDTALFVKLFSKAGGRNE